jgi:hypothetical protein
MLVLFLRGLLQGLEALLEETRAEVRNAEAAGADRIKGLLQVCLSCALMG